LPRTPTSDAMRLFLDGRIALAKKQWRAALSQFKEARRFQADMPDMLERTDLAIAACYRELDDTPAEISSLRQIVKYHPKSVPGRLALAAALLRQQDLAGAIAEYRPLASLPHVRLLLARLLILQNLQLPEVAREWREAETLLNDATQQHSDPTQIVLLRAELLTAKGQFATAQRLLKDARTSQADRLEFLVALARLAKQAGDEHRAALWMGQALASAGNSAEAEVQLRQAIELAPQDTAAARTLMELYVATDRRDAAVDLFRKYAPKMSTKELAQTYALFGDHARAAALFERESAQNQADLSSLDGLASVYLQSQMLPEAEATLERLVRDADATSIIGQSGRRRLALLLSRRNDRQSRVRALQLLDENVAASEQSAPDDLRARAAVLASASLAEERNQAVELLESLDDQNQLLPQDRWLLGRLYQAAGRTDEASHQLERSIASGEVSERLLADYAEHLVEHADEETARNWVTRLCSQYPEAADSLRLETRLAVRYGDSQQAVSLLKSFVAEARDDASRTARLIKAAAVASDSNSDGNGALDVAASEFLTEAVQLDPKQIGQQVIWQLNHDRDVEAFEHLDDVWQQLKPDAAAGISLAMLSAGPTHVRAARVEKQLTAALRKNPGELLAKVCLADVQSLQERYAEAESLYRQVLHVDPQSLPALNNLAWLLGMQNRATDEALSLIERAIEAAGPAPQLLDTRACILISQGRTRQASTDLKKSIADGGTTPTTLLHLAAAQLDDGDAESARQTFEQAKAAGLSELLLHPLDRALLHRVADSLRTEQPTASNDV
jgi:Tfp pilus assembly protein PilF